MRTVTNCWRFRTLTGGGVLAKGILVGKVVRTHRAHQALLWIMTAMVRENVRVVSSIPSPCGWGAARTPPCASSVRPLGEGLRVSEVPCLASKRSSFGAAKRVPAPWSIAFLQLCTGQSDSISCTGSLKQVHFSVWFDLRIIPCGQAIMPSYFSRVPTGPLVFQSRPRLYYVAKQLPCSHRESAG